MKKKYRISKTNLTTRMINDSEQLGDMPSPKVYHCENCGFPVITWHVSDFKFCLNCGAKVVSKKAKKQ